MTKFLTLFLLTILTTVSCMPQQAVRPQLSVENNDISNNTNSGETENNSNSETVQPLQWLDNGSLSNVLTINEDNAKNIYLFGDDINSYLDSTENYQGNYCALIDFQASLDKDPKQLRVRLIPHVTYNSNTGQSSRYFRVNLNSSTGNDECNHDSFKETITTVDTYVPADVTNSVDGICSNCLNIITSTSIVLYKKTTDNTTGPNNVPYLNGYLEQVPNVSVDYESLTLRVDINNNSSNNTPSCNNTECQAQGFDCCLQGQCVNDAGLKNSRAEVLQKSIDINDSNYLTEFDYAEAQKINNPLLYLQYPQYYYICLENVPNDGSSGPLDPSDPAGDAKKRLREMISDFYCIEELKENSSADPFHTDPYNSSETYKACNLVDDPNADPDMFYKDVMSRMYKHCGCVSDTYDEMVANCPKYTYKEIYNTSGSEYKLSDLYALMTTENVTSPLSIEELADITDIARIECVSPEVDPNILPFSDMNVIVNSKTAPHRFFDADTDSNDKSIEITDVSELPLGASGVQEGDPFQYLDDEKLFPLNGSFNMNSILGQMTIDLSQAMPAKKIDLDFDTMYYIATLDGYFTPCPSCAKDSWFPNFSPNPMTTQGTGLQSIGHTTRRDSWGSNTTFGNYEDTIFGRACWLPPTMIPFSHDEDADQQTQRLNRLKTQSAYYTNGYQRDWFGFNKGALIGSFDGVSWFAIGKGRVVKSTSKKLFLAINAPFADLTQYNDHLVTVQEWDFITTGPQYDYNPDESINSVFQNEAGLCQRNHQCESDSDCITQLGWEYSCIDVNQYTTKWPQFDPTTATEIENTSREGTIISFLAQAELPPGTSSKKCVYRGAGSPCRIDYDQITDSGKRQALACAPNFYCAALSQGAVYNTEVARYAGVLQDISVSKNHYFGKDANHLGRPKDYISTGNLSSLPALSQSAINDNLTTIDSTGSGNFGICRPGKKLPDYQGFTATVDSDFIDQQKESDPLYRTDYISQISSCNSSLYTDLRMSSCPMLDDEGNYVHLNDDYNNNSLVIESLGITTGLSRKYASLVYGHSQNSCGMEVLDSSAVYGQGISANTLSNYSAFKAIEGKSLASSDVQYEPTLTRDACFRKAGAVCHTDLDCSPNYKHSDLIDILNPAFFGNTAEKKYWQEYLVCGQGQNEPLTTSDPDFNTYDITNNRCCREIGKEITMYTEDSAGVDESTNLQTHKFGSYHPSNPNRYSRYNNLNSHYIEESGRTPSGGFIRPSANTDKTSSGTLTSSPNIQDLLQWKTFNGSAKRTCCGGGWVRKFADGTNNWSINRLNIDVTNFRCLSFNSPLINTDYPEPFGLTNSLNNQDSQNYCVDTSMSGANCTQRTFGEMSYTISRPVINEESGTMELITRPDVMKDEWQHNLWAFLPLFIADSGNPLTTYLDWGSGKVNPDLDPDTGATRRHLSFKLPSYITWPEGYTIDTAPDVEIKLQLPTDGANEYRTCDKLSTPDPASNPGFYDCGANGSTAWHGLCTPRDPVTNPTTPWASQCAKNGTDNENCCYMYNPLTRVIKIAHNYGVITDDLTAPDAILNPTVTNYDHKDLGMKLTFIAPGTERWEEEYVSTIPVDQYATADTNGYDSIHHRRSATPGNAYYYLKKLEKLELLGIPQITYEPLYCADNYQKMVPGIFKTEVSGQPLTNIVEFNDHPDTFIGSSSTTPYKDDSADPSINANSLNEPRIATQELVDHEPIFSDHEFLCCSPLGTKVNSDQISNCCSGYGVSEDSGGNNPNAKVICKLPAGADLNLYFNKFISGEGMSSNEEDPLTEDDFDEKTGYPRFNETVLQKLKTLAIDHCASEDYAHGGAFGPYVAEPHGSLGKNNDADSNRIYSIVDSVYDEGSNNDRAAGFEVFNSGLKWNHHIYCAPGSAD